MAVQRECSVCGLRFTSRRSDARVCSDTCRQRKKRQRKRLPAWARGFVQQAREDAAAVAQSVIEGRREVRQVPLRSVTFSAEASTKRRGGGGIQG